jgi:hypothetical protein
MAKLDQLEVNIIDQLKAARILFLAASLEAEVRAMSAANLGRTSQGESPAYVDEFYSVLESYKQQVASVLGASEQPQSSTDGIGEELRQATADLASVASAKRLLAFRIQYLGVDQQGNPFLGVSSGSTESDAWEQFRKRAGF